MSSLFYVQVAPDPTDSFALCNYFTDYECTHQVDSPLQVPLDAGLVSFVLVPYIASANPNPDQANTLLLVGAVADRVDTPVIDPTLMPAAVNAVTVALPTNKTVMKGMVLVFSSQGAETQLYASADPQVVNTDA